MSLDPRPRRVASVLFILALTIRGAASAPQVIATDGAPTGPRTGLIVGQVVDGTTGAPVPEAIVRLTMPRNLENLPTTPNGRVIVDDEGRFFFSDLPAGEGTTLEPRRTDISRGTSASGERQTRVSC